MEGLGGLNQLARGYQADCAEAPMKRREMTYIERVNYAVEAAEQQLADLKRMKEIFAQHPEFEELLTLVQRGRV